MNKTNGKKFFADLYSSCGDPNNHLPRCKWGVCRIGYTRSGPKLVRCSRITSVPYPIGLGLRKLSIYNYRSIRVTPTLRDSSGGTTGLLERPKKVAMKQVFWITFDSYLNVWIKGIPLDWGVSNRNSFWDRG